MLPGRSVTVTNPMWNRPGTRRPTWNFVCHVRDPKTGTETIEVIGGKNGHFHNHAFRPDEVNPVPIKTRRRRRTA